jgi:hypothetical protein
MNPDVVALQEVIGAGPRGSGQEEKIGQQLEANIKKELGASAQLEYTSETSRIIKLERDSRL